MYICISYIVYGINDMAVASAVAVASALLIDLKIQLRIYDMVTFDILEYRNALLMARFIYFMY